MVRCNPTTLADPRGQAGLAHRGSFWEALESSRGLLSVPACWRARLGDEFEAFREGFLSKSARPAKYYPCPSQCGCMHEIVDLHAVCRCPEPHCPDIPVSPDEAVLLELSWTKLSRALCSSLNLDTKPLDLGLLNTRQIGSWSAAGVPAVLTIQTDHARFRAVSRDLAARLGSRFILLVPTSRHYDAVCQELIERAGAGFFPLEGNVRLMPAGVLQSIKSPGQLFAAFNPDEGSEPGEDVARLAFALVEQLEGSKPPAPIAVFRLYCMEGLSASRIARQLRCSKPTVLRRLKLIERRIGVAPAKLRCYSGHLEAIEEHAQTRL